MLSFFFVYIIVHVGERMPTLFCHNFFHVCQLDYRWVGLWVHHYSSLVHIDSHFLIIWYYESSVRWLVAYG